MSQHGKFWINQTTYMVYEIIQIRRHQDVCSSLPLRTGGSLCFAPSFGDRHFWLRSWSDANLGHITSLSWSGPCQLLQAHFSPFLTCPLPSNNCKHHVALPYLPLLLPLSPSLGNPCPILITHLMAMCPLTAHLSAGFDTDPGAGTFFAWFETSHPHGSLKSLSLLFSFLCKILLLCPLSVLPLNVGIAQIPEVVLFSLLIVRL